MRRSRTEETIDLTARLQQVEQLEMMALAGFDAPSDDEGLDEAPVALRETVAGNGRMFVVGSTAAPRFRAVTWLGTPRRDPE